MLSVSIAGQKFIHIIMFVLRVVNSKIGHGLKLKKIKIGGVIMEVEELLNSVLYIVLTVIIPLIAKYVVNFIKVKISETKVVEEITKNESLSKIVESAVSDVMDAVLYVNQTYVDSLKESGKFNDEAQTIAFNKAYTKSLSLISEGTKNVIEEIYGSFDKWLSLKIESSVNIAKK